MNLFPRRKKLFASRSELRRKRRNKHLGVLAAVVALLLGGAFLASQYSGGPLLAGLSNLSDGQASRDSQGSGAQAAPRSDEGEARDAGAGDAGGVAGKEDAKKAPPEEPLPDLAQPSPEAAAFVAVAPELPGVGRENVTAVYRSRMDPSWASVRFAPEGESKNFVVFSHLEGGSWRAERSMRADEADYAKNDVVPLAGVPRDLLDYLYTKNVFAAEVPEPKPEKVDGLPDVDPAEKPPVVATMDGVPEDQRERVEAVLGKVEDRVGGYSGVAGVYVRDLDAGLGYGVRADEEFFSASIIKVPVMVAVYRKVEQGELSFSQKVEIQEEDWAAGAGWLQWREAGTEQVLGDLLILMMTQSDNVATNALVRLVGGKEHVNEVARSLGAENTLLYQKVSSERGAVPAIDNRTTPRDMAVMMQKIADDEAANAQSCGYMRDLMRTNELDWWLDAGLPDGVDAANKAGWLYESYGDVGIVEHDGHRYTVAILSKHGTGTVDDGAALIEDLSRTAWEAQSGTGDASSGEDSGEEENAS